MAAQAEYSLEFIHPNGTVSVRDFGTKAKCLKTVKAMRWEIAKEFPAPWKMQIRNTATDPR